MQQITIIISPNETIFQKISSHKFGNSDEQIIKIFKNIDDVQNFVSEGFLGVLVRIIYADTAKNLIDSEFQNHDIIIPNTYISTPGEAQFLENTVGNEYDFESFKLHLSGVCVEKGEITAEENNFIGDIENTDIFTFLDYICNQKLSDITTAIFSLSNEEKDIHNLISIIDFIIQE